MAGRKSISSMREMLDGDEVEELLMEGGQRPLTPKEREFYRSPNVSTAEAHELANRRPY